MQENVENKTENIDLMLKSAWLAVAKMYSDMAQSYEATAVQALTLLKIDPKNGTRSTLLGPKMAVEPTSISRIIKLLENTGYIYKEKTPNDKREVIIKLTEKGLKHRDISKETVLNFNKLIHKKLTTEQLETFKQVMRIITETTKELNNRK